MTSKYVEGFTLFTADDEIMLSNLKQAINYSKQNLAISDVATPTQKSTSTTKESSGGYAPSATEASAGASSGSVSGGVSVSGPTSGPTSLGASVSGAAAVNKFKNIKNKKEKFTNKNKEKYEEEYKDKYEEFQEFKEFQEEDQSEYKKKKQEKFKSNGKDEKEEEEEDEEGFQGSQQLNLDTTKKLLLSLLITFFGYVVLIYGPKENIISMFIKPVFFISKNLQYCAIFFLAVYLCITVF